MCSNEDHLIQLHMTEPAARDMLFRFRERNSELDWSCVARIDLEQVASDVNVDALQALVAQVLTARVLPTQLPTQPPTLTTAATASHLGCSRRCALWRPAWGSLRCL